MSLAFICLPESPRYSMMVKRNKEVAEKSGWSLEGCGWSLEDWGVGFGGLEVEFRRVWVEFGGLWVEFRRGEGRGLSRWIAVRSG